MSTKHICSKPSAMPRYMIVTTSDCANDSAWYFVDKRIAKKHRSATAIAYCPWCGKEL